MRQSRLRAGVNLTVSELRKLLHDNIDIFIQFNHLRDNSLRITEIAELAVKQAGVFEVNPIFEYMQVGVERDKIIGRHRPFGVMPRCNTHFEKAGIYLPPSFYGANPERTGKNGVH